MKAVTAVNVTAMVRRKPQPGSGTALALFLEQDADRDRLQDGHREREPHGGAGEPAAPLRAFLTEGTPARHEERRDLDEDEGRDDGRGPEGEEGGG
jgi:hypothetical protein